MKFIFIAAIFFILFLLVLPSNSFATFQAPIKGVGACHWVPGDIGSGTGIDWAYETSFNRGITWVELEPRPDQFNFLPLDRFINRFKDNGAKIWLSFQTVSSGLYGPKAPSWLWQEKGAIWHTGTGQGEDCSKNGIFAPWDPNYQERLRILLREINAHLESQNSDYKNTIGGIMMMSGGMYGEMQLFSCNIRQTLMDYYHYSGAQQLNENYYRAVSQIVDIYMQSFPNWPIMLSLGYNENFVKPGGTITNVDKAVVEDKIRQYGNRLLLKWNGLDPNNVGDGKDDIRFKQNSYYRDFFKSYYLQTQVGYEVGHPIYYQNPPGSGSWETLRFENAFQWARESKASFVCFQTNSDPALDMLGALRLIPGWTQFDKDLEANIRLPAPTLLNLISNYGSIFKNQDLNGDTMINGIDFSKKLLNP